MNIPTHLTTGKTGETIAISYLEKNGYKILERNFRCPIGEIDIIAKDKDEWVFVEVKTRKSLHMGYPEQAVGGRKQKKISQTALWYMQKNNLSGVNARFDVVAVTISDSENETRLIKNAFEFISPD